MRWRLLAAFLGVMLVMLVAQDVPLAGHLRRVEQDRQLADLERDAFVLAAATTEALALDDPSELANLRETVRSFAAENERRIVVTDGDGVVQAAAASGSDIGDDLSRDADIAAALRTESAAGDAGDTVSVAVPVLRGAEAIGAVRLATPAAVVDARADEKVRGLLAVALISLAAAVVAAVVLASSVSRPLRRLQLGTERVAGGDFAEPVDDTEGPPEVRHLASSFNAMTERVSRLVEQQRAFAGDASHQLRTPLTALRLQLERTAELLDDDDTAGARRNLDAAMTETARLQRLIDGLLMLARTDTTAAVARDVVDVGAVVEERVATWQSLAEERGVTMTVAVTRTAPALAAPGALEQILDNYLDNAIEVAPAGTAVDVVVAGDAAAVRVHVLDRGPGMSDDERERAFERFWRAPGGGPEGAGLGLAIVARLAAASGGRAEVASRPGGGLDASVVLPVAAAAR